MERCLAQRRAMSKKDPEEVFGALVVTENAELVVSELVA